MSLKDFVIISKLGEGAYSSVYKVQRIVDSQIYALKKVKMSNLSQKQQQNALNEVRILASVKSPYIVGYKHAFIESNSLCIVMEYSDDGDLYQKISQHTKDQTSFSEDQIWKTLIHMTLALKKLHQLQILHRDLKSANVFLSKSVLGKSGISKLGDMNVSKIAKNGLLYTQTGTPYYASPEVWRDKPYDGKSDIWSLGCVIYEMTTLKPPFRAEDMDGLYKKVIKGSYSKIGDNYSKNLSNAIKMLLQVNPANRPSAAQLLKTLGAKAMELNIEIEQPEMNPEFLKTIRPNKNLHYLTERLPQSNYQNGYEYEKNPKLNLSAKGKNQIKPNNNLKPINLPKLDRVLIKGSNLKNLGAHLQQDRMPNPIIQARPSKVDINQMLKIQGKSNNPRYNLEYQQQKRNAERDIRNELRKIYNIKPSPLKKMRKKIGLELPKIN